MTTRALVVCLQVRIPEAAAVPSRQVCLCLTRCSEESQFCLVFHLTDGQSSNASRPVQQTSLGLFRVQIPSQGKEL